MCGCWQGGVLYSQQASARGLLLTKVDWEIFFGITTNLSQNVLPALSITAFLHLVSGGVWRLLGWRQEH